MKNIILLSLLFSCAFTRPALAQSDCAGSGCGKKAKARIEVSGSQGFVTFFGETIAAEEGKSKIIIMDVAIPEGGIFQLAAQVPPVSGPNDIRHSVFGAFTVSTGCKEAKGVIWAGGECTDLLGCQPYPCMEQPHTPDECCQGYHCSDAPESFESSRSETFTMKDVVTPSSDPGTPSDPSTSNSTTGGAITAEETHKADDQVSMSFSLGYGPQGLPIGNIAYTVSTRKEDTSVPGLDSIHVNLTGLEPSWEPQVRNLTGGIRQYYTGSAFIEFVPVPGGIHINTYRGVDAVVPVDENQPIEPALGTAVAKIAVLRLPVKVGGVAQQAIKIMKLTVSGPPWEATYSSDTPSSGSQVAVRFEGSKMIKQELKQPVANEREEVISVYARDPATPDNDPGYFKVSEETHKYRRYITSDYSAERLIETKLGSAAMAPQITQYYYDENEGQDAYGELLVRINPDGSWIRYEFEPHNPAPDPERPKLKAEYSSWLDAGGNGTGAPTLSSVLAVPASDCAVVEYEEAEEPVYFKKTVRKIKGVTVSRTEVTKESVLDAFSGENVEIERTVVYDGSGQILSDDRHAIKRNLPENGITSLAEELVYDASADGSRRSYATTTSVDELAGVTVTSTVVHGTQLQPAGIPGRTLKEVSVTSPGGSVQTSSYIFKGPGVYELASQEARSIAIDGLDRTETVTRDGAIVSTVDYLANATEAVADDTVATTDAYGLKSIRSFNPSTGVSTVTRVGGGQVLAGTESLFDGHDVITKTSYLPRPPVSSQVPPGQVIKTEVTANGTTRQTSWIEYDEQGRQVKTVDSEGITRTYAYLYTNGMLTVSVVGPGNVKQTTEYYRDGRVKTVETALTTGPVTSSPKSYCTYDVAPGGFEIETVHVKTATDLRWSRTTKDAQGRTVLQEQPGTGGSIQKLENFYDSTGNLVRIRKSGFLKDELMEYDSQGKLFRRGYDLNDNGVLDVASSEPIVETTQYYEQQLGDWWQSIRTRVYEQNQAGGYRESFTRAKLKGIDGPSEIWTNGRLDRSINIQINRSTREKITTTVLASSSIPGVEKVIGGLRFHSRAPGALMETEYRYTKFMEVSRQTVPGGHISYSYDSYGRIATETQATGATGNDAGTSRVTTYAYYAPNLTTADAGKLQTKSAPTSAFSPTAQVTNYKYDSIGRLIGEWGPGTLPVKYDYNDYGERDRMTLYQTQTTNLNTEPTWTSTTNGLTTWIYDAATGLLTSKKDDANQSVSYTYHAGTNLVQRRTWARGVYTDYAYDGLGRETGRNYSDATTDVTIAYRRDGAVEQITDASGSRIFSDWDRHGHPQKEAINGTGLLSGLELISPRDHLGRRTGFEAQFSGTSPALLQLPSSVWEYGADGQLSKVKQGPLSVSLTHTADTSADTRALTRLDSGSSESALSSIAKSNLPRGRFSVAHSRSADFAQSRVKSDSTGIVEYADPSLGVLAPDSESSSWQYSWDTRGQISSTRKYLGNGVNAYAKLLDTKYEYDDAGNRKEARRGTGAGTAQVPGDSGLTRPTFTVNSLNQTTAVTHPTNLIYVTGKAPSGMTPRVGLTSATTATPDRQGHYFSDALTRPTSPSVKFWVDLYFKAYQGTTTTPYALRSGGVYVPGNSETVTYDLDGNMAADDRWDYTWDAENRLIQMNTRAARVTATSGVPNLKLTFKYDAGGRRISKKLEKTVSGVTQTLNDVLFIYDGWNLVGEIETANTAADKPGNSGTARFLRRSYLWGPDISGTWDGAGGVGGLLATTRHVRRGQEAETYWATSDLNGNVVGLLATRSKKVALYEYDAFGRQVAVNEPEAGLNPIRFSSKYTDAETGFSYYGYRYYSAELGRWISRDPIGDRGGINLYTMLGNDLANEADKLGLINWEKTGVKQCFDGVVHTYIMIDGVSYGFYPKSRSSSDPIDALKNAINIIEGPGVVTSPDPLASQGQTCRDLQVNTTCIEASKVKGHVLDYLNKNLASNNLTYTCNVHNCARFVWDAGLAGVQNSKKKNLNFGDKCACTFSMTHKWE